jgi:hypothetical protein
MAHFLFLLLQRMFLLDLPGAGDMQGLPGILASHEACRSSGTVVFFPEMDSRTSEPVLQQLLEQGVLYRYAWGKDTAQVDCIMILVHKQCYVHCPAVHVHLITENSLHDSGLLSCS